MLNEEQIAALETVAKLASKEEGECGEAGLYDDAETARMVGAWCRGRIEENAREVAQ